MSSWDESGLQRAGKGLVKKERMAEVMLEMWVDESHRGARRGKGLILALELGKMAQAVQRERGACMRLLW